MKQPSACSLFLFFLVFIFPGSSSLCQKLSDKLCGTVMSMIKQGGTAVDQTFNKHSEHQSRKLPINIDKNQFFYPRFKYCMTVYVVMITFPVTIVILIFFLLIRIPMKKCSFVCSVT